MQECTLPRNSWSQTHQNDETWGEARMCFARDLKSEHRIDRFAHASENSTGSLSTTLRGDSQGHSFFFLLSIVRRNRNDSVPVSTM